MPRLRKLWENAYPVLIGVGVALLLLAAGFRTDTLPVIPGTPDSDAIISHWTAALSLQESARMGSFPLWRNLLMSGAPFAANPLNKVWYPLQWAVIVLPPTLHLNLLVWLHLVIAALGMRAFARQLKIRLDAAHVMGIAWALTPRLIGALGAGHLDIVYAIGWFPCVLWAVERLLNADRVRVVDSVILAVIAAMAFLADMRLSVFIFATAAAWGILGLLTRDRVKWPARFGGFVLSGAVCLGLTAVAWMPLITLAPYLSRSGMTPTDAGVFSLDPFALLGIIVPRLVLNQESITTVGFGLFLLAAGGCWYALRENRQALFWAGIALFAGFYALGINGFLWPELTRVLPILLWLRVPARAWIVVNFAALVLAGLFLNRLRSRTLIVILGVAIAGELLFNDAALVSALPQSSWLDAYQPLAQTLLDAGVKRYYTPSYSVPQQVGMYWHLSNFGGVDPFQFKDFIPPFEAASGVHAGEYSVMLPEPNIADTLHANQNAMPDADLLGKWGVTHVIASFPIAAPDLDFVKQINDLYLYSNRRVDYPVVAWTTPNCATVDFSHAVAPDAIAYLWPQVPGWNLPNTTLQTGIITIRAGVTTEGCYQPPDLRPSLAISSLTLIFGGVAVVWSRRHA
jgi:hypothetical protein